SCSFRRAGCVLRRGNLESLCGTMARTQSKDDRPTLERSPRGEFFQSCDWPRIPDFCRKRMYETRCPVRDPGNGPQRGLKPGADLQVRVRGRGAGDDGVVDSCVGLLHVDVSPPNWVFGLPSTARRLFETDVLLGSDTGCAFCDSSGEGSFLVRTSWDGSCFWRVLFHRHPAEPVF